MKKIKSSIIKINDHILNIRDLNKIGVVRYSDKHYHFMARGTYDQINIEFLTESECIEARDNLFKKWRDMDIQNSRLKLLTNKHRYSFQKK